MVKRVQTNYDVYTYRYNQDNSDIILNRLNFGRSGLKRLTTYPIRLFSCEIFYRI